MTAVTMKDFRAALVKLKDTRAWSNRWKIDAWAFRQALLTILVIDTQAALERGVTQAALDKFDAGARQEIQKFLEASPP